MKKLLRMFFMIAFLAGVSVPADSGFVSNTDSFAIEASFGTTFGMTIFILRDGSWGNKTTSMDFGTLVEFVDSGTGGRTLRSSGNFLAMIYPQPSGTAQYHIDSTGTALSNGTTTLPAGACVVVPVYVSSDQWDPNAGIPLTGTLGSSGTWIGASDRRIYTSNSAGDYRAIRAYFSITDDPAAGSTAAVPVNQPSGHYAGTVTFTITE